MPNPAADRSRTRRPAQGGTRTRRERGEPGLEAGELQEQIARLKAREGGADQALDLVMTENKRYRERHREDSEYIEELEAIAVPEGSVAVTKEDADLLTKFKELNLAPDKITEALKERDTLAEKDRKATLAKENSAAAKKAGYNGDALNELLDAKGHVIEMKEITVVENGKREKQMVPHVRPLTSKPGENLRPLADVVSTDWKVWEPALKARDAEGGDDDVDTGYTDTPFVGQRVGATGDQKPKKLADQVQGVIKDDLNDLFPKQQ